MVKIKSGTNRAHQEAGNQLAPTDTRGVRKKTNKSKVSNKPKRKTKQQKKKSASEFLYSLDLPRLLRLLFFLLIVGIIVYQYYLLTEDKLASTYLNFWNKNKNIVVPSLLFIGYTLIVFLFGYRTGKRR